MRTLRKPGRLSLIGVLLAGWLLAACSDNTPVVALTASNNNTPTVSGISTTASSTTLSATSQTAAPNSPLTRLYLREESTKLSLITLPGGVVERQLPFGVISPDWKMLYTTTSSGNQTTVAALDLTTGQTLRTTTLAGQFVLPGIDANIRLGGLSPDGKVLVLVEKARSPSATLSRMVVLDTAFQSSPRFLELPGTFVYDALSPKGQYLYLIEHLPPAEAGRYQVRKYDLATNQLLKEPVFEKGESEAIMEGYSGAQVVGNNGSWVYTIYRNNKHGPFIHALNTEAGVAACLDLPQAGKENEDAAMYWTLTINSSGHTIYAVNRVLGQAVEIVADWPQIGRSATFPASAPSSTRPLPLSSNTLSLTNDGAKLLVIGEKGLMQINTKNFSVSGQLATNWKLESIMADSEGNRLYAPSNQPGKILTIDLTTGAILSELSRTPGQLGLMHIG